MYKPAINFHQEKNITVYSKKQQRSKHVACSCTY